MHLTVRGTKSAEDKISSSLRRSQFAAVCFCPATSRHTRSLERSDVKFIKPNDGLAIIEDQIITDHDETFEIITDETFENFRNLFFLMMIPMMMLAQARDCPIGEAEYMPIKEE